MSTQGGKPPPRYFNYIYHTKVSYLLFHCHSTWFQDVFLAGTESVGPSVLAQDSPGFGSQEVIGPGEALAICSPYPNLSMCFYPTPSRPRHCRGGKGVNALLAGPFLDTGGGVLQFLFSSLPGKSAKVCYSTDSTFSLFILALLILSVSVSPQ